MLIDAGDTIQGTPLAYYYARVDPITDGASVHPMAEAMNIIGYDAAALGNHEFNYGIDTLRVFQEQLDFPLLGANAVDAATKLPAFPPYFIKSFTMPDGKVVKVGVLGLTNPGIAIWDKANVEGRMEFPGLVEQAKVFVPRLRKAGADIVVVRRTRRGHLLVAASAALPRERRHPGRAACARHRRDPRRPRPQGDRGALGHQRGHR
jgi:2',3'-cyclic-nucleotide 2'-phosphodiesterase/3'-nucleotidase